MGRVQISPEAEQDLLELWLYIAEDSPENADRFLDRLDATAQRLANLRDLGRIRPELAPGLRSLPVDHYVLFYRPVADGIALVRVVRGSRDIDALF